MIKAVFLITLVILAVQGSELKMPSLSTVGETVSLSCGVDVPDSKIKSVTWLKDGMEFYRYESIIPKPKLDFVSLVRGISIDRSDVFSNGNIIRIKLLTRESCGRYVCFVEIEHPILKFVEMGGTLKVVDTSPCLMDCRRSFSLFPSSI